VAFYVWRVTNGAFDNAENWSDVTTGADPAPTPPGPSDNVDFNTAGGTITGNGSVGPFTIEPGAAGAWVFTGQITTPSGSIESTTSFTTGAVLTVTGSTDSNGYLPFGMTLNAPVTFDDATLASAAATLSVGAGYSALAAAGASLTLQDGSSATVLGAVIGQGASGTLTVTGSSTFSTVANASLNTTSGTSGYLTIGQQSTTSNGTTDGNGTLIVTSNGTVNVGSGFIIGLDQGSIGSATIASGGTISAQGGYTTIGAEGGSFGSLVVSSGGTFSLGANSIAVGNQAGSVGSLTVSSGGTFTVTEAPQAANYVLEIGENATSGVFVNASGTVTVTGSGALLTTNDNPIAVGLGGTGVLNVLSGGTVSAGTTNDATIAAISLGRAGSATVNIAGPGSLLDLAGYFYAGRAGDATINVTSSGSLVDTSISAGDFAGIGDGGSINGVFSDGGTASLNINTGGSASFGADLIAGYNGDSGSISVSGGMLTVASALDLGGGSLASGGEGYLTVAGGGVVENTGGAITSAYQLTAGISAGTTGTILVSGPGSLVNEGPNAARIGDYGDGSLTVTDGGTFDAASPDSNLIPAFLVGQYSGGSGSVLVSGAGSTLTASGYTDLGEGGTATVTIEDGAVFTGGQVSSGSTPAENFVIGGGNPTSNTETGSANTPNFGGSGLVEVLSGGTLSSLAGLRVGYRGDSGTLIVSGGSSLAQAIASIRVGTANNPTNDRTGGNGTVLVEGGATLRSLGPHTSGTASVVIADTAGTTGSITVTGSGSLLDAGGDRIDVGSEGGGTLLVSGGGTVSAGSTYYSDAEAGFSVGTSGGTGSALVTGSGSLIAVDGAISIDGSLSATSGGSGVLAVSSGGTVTTTGLTLWAGGSVSVDSASLIQIGTAAVPVTTTGLVIEAGMSVAADGGTITGAVSNEGTLSNAGALTISGDVTGTGTLALAAGSTTAIDGSFTGQTIEFSGSGDTLTLDSLLGASSVTQIQAGDTVDLAGVTDAGFADDTLSTPTGSMSFSGFAPGSVPVFMSDGMGGEEVYVACYCVGTAILTVAGERPVETLCAGDFVVTQTGRARTIRWLGRRSYAARFVARHPNVQPIRLRAGALGGGLPRRDLLVSPEHAMFIDGILVPARCLANGSSIVQERGLERVDYVHVELESHDVILAEGAPSETFLDDNSRQMFHNSAEFARLYPDAPAPGQFCAPKVDHGYELEAIRRRLAEVAGVVAVAA
jgi:T5SS/PEP-CTERM-associated repeat protein